MGYAVRMSPFFWMKSLLLATWLLCMGWLIRFEAFPHWFDRDLRGYRELSGRLPALQDSWMKVLADGKQVGYLNSTVEMREEEGKERLLLGTRLHLRLRVGGRGESLRFVSEVRLNARQELMGSSSNFFMGDLEGDLELVSTGEKEMYTLRARLKDVQWNRDIRIPREAVVSSPLLDAGLRSVRPGRTLRIRTLDPFSMSGELRTVELEGLSSGMERPPGYPKPVEVTHVVLRMGDLRLDSWVDAYGRVVRQTTPFGLSMVIADAQEAMEVPEGNAVDPLTLMSGFPLPSPSLFPTKP